MRRSAALGLLAAAGTSAGVRSVSDAQTLVPIRVGNIGASDASAESLYAQATGIFKKYGLVSEGTGISAGAVIAAMVGGSLDIGFANVVSLAQALEHDIPVVALIDGAIYPGSHPDTLLVKARGSALRTGADLSGKTVGVGSLNGSLQTCASAWIDKNGGDPRTVRFVEAGFAEMAAALKAGRLDAAMIAEPALSRQLADVDVLGDPFLAVGPRWTIGVWVTSKAWAAAHPDSARQFVRAMIETAHWANAHHAESAQLLSGPSHIDLATFAQMTRSTYGDALNAPMLQPQIDAAFKYGNLKQPFDARAIVADAQPYWRSPNAHGS
jgi:NitT/TauT family transport system substrate-binding protein